MDENNIIELEKELEENFRRGHRKQVTKIVAYMGLIVIFWIFVGCMIVSIPTVINSWFGLN